MSSGGSNTTGCYNTFLGEYSGHCNTTGCYNTFLGTNSGWSNTIQHHVTIVGNIPSVEASYDFAFGSKSPEGNNYLFTCCNSLYWCHCTSLTKIA